MLRAVCKYDAVRCVMLFAAEVKLVGSACVCWDDGEVRVRLAHVLLYSQGNLSPSQQCELRETKAFTLVWTP